MAHPLRGQLSRQKGWRKPLWSIVVSRPTKWGNPFRTADQFRMWLSQGRWYHHYLVKPIGVHELIDRRTWMLSHLSELRGNLLLCWCRPEAECHADVLAELANQ